MPKFLTEDTMRGRVRVTEPVPCAICKQHTHNLDLLWSAFICSDECTAAYESEYMQTEEILDALMIKEDNDDESNV